MEASKDQNSTLSIVQRFTSLKCSFDLVLSQKKKKFKREFESNLKIVFKKKFEKQKQKQTNFLKLS